MNRKVITLSAAAVCGFCDWRETERLVAYANAERHVEETGHPVVFADEQIIWLGVWPQKLKARERAELALQWLTGSPP